VSIKKIVFVSAAALCAGCEGTWATPNQIALHAVHGSHVSGLATAQLNVARLRGNLAPGSDIDAQFQALRDPRPYVLLVERGTCARPGDPVAKFALYAYPDEPSEGLESSGHVDVPIHDLLKKGYALVLLDRRKNAAVSCGDLVTDRPF
jgi:hypothetical protein